MQQLLVGRLCPSAVKLERFSFYAQSRHLPPTSLRFGESVAATGLVRASVWTAIVTFQGFFFQTCRHAGCSPFRSYLFLLAARCCLRRGQWWQRPAAPTPVPLVPSGPAGAPSPPHSMGGPSHFLQRAAHKDVFVSCTREKEAVVSLRIRTLLSPQKKEKKKRHISLYFYYDSIIYIFTSFSPFHTVQECRGNHSSRRAGIRPASETADFNLYLNPLGPRVQTQTKLLGLCRERVRLKSFFSYSAPCGDAIYEEKEFLSEEDVEGLKIYLTLSIFTMYNHYQFL